MTPPSSQTSKLRPLFDYLRKQQENKKFLKTIEISGTFLLIAFFSYFAIRPTVITISALNGDIESKKILKNELKEKINKVIEAQDLYSQVQEKYYVVNSSLPDMPKYYDASLQLVETSQKLGVVTDDLTFNLDPNAQKKALVDTKSFSVNTMFKSSFNNGLKIVSDLLNNRRIININGITFAVENTKNQIATPSASGNVVVNFSSLFYFWPSQNEKK